MKKIIVAIVLVEILLSIGSFNLSVTNVELDDSWHNVYKWLLQQNYNFGKDIIYTFGPLAGYLLNSYNSEYIMSNTLVNIGFVFYFIMLIFCIKVKLENNIINVKSLGISSLAIAIFLILWPIPDVMAFIIVLCSFSYMRLLNYKYNFIILVQILLLVVLSNIKFSYLLAILLCFCISILLGFARKEYKEQCILFFIYVCCFIIVWILIGQSIYDLPAYFYNFFDMALAYNGAMGAIYIKYWQIFDIIAILTLVLAIFSITYGINKEKFLSREFLDFDIGIFAIFLLWTAFKYGMGRHDLHQNAFFEYVMLVSILLPSIYKNSYKLSLLNKVSFIIYMVSALCVILGTSMVYHNKFDVITSRVNIPIQNIQSNYSILFNTNSIKRIFEQNELNIYQKEASLTSFAKIINNDTVDVYNYRQNYAILNDFNYRPRPVFQGYQTFTKNLMEKNENFILTNPSDYIIFKQETIDNRLGLMDDSMWLAEVLNNYDLVAEERDLLLLKKKENFQEVKRFKVSDGVVDFDDIIDIPCKNGERISISMEIENSVFGKILSMLWKPPIVEMELIKDNGDVVVRRIIPSMIRTPVYIDGVIDNNDDVINLVNGTLKNKITKIKIKKPFMYNWLFNCNIKYTLYAERVNNHWLLDK